MPEITIRQSTFERLQHHAKPFVDTPETVILRGLDALDQREEPIPNGQPTETEVRLDPSALPDVKHTRVMDASIDGEAIKKPNWNQLLDELLRRSSKRVGTFEDIVRLFPVNLAKGRKEDDGFRYLPEIDISVQGQPANSACRAVIAVAQALGISLNFGIAWRSKEGAAYPGESRRIVV